MGELDTERRRYYIWECAPSPIRKSREMEVDRLPARGQRECTKEETGDDLEGRSFKVVLCGWTTEEVTMTRPNFKRAQQVLRARPAFNIRVLRGLILSCGETLQFEGRYGESFPREAYDSEKDE